jgi:hypothetical protein
VARVGHVRVDLNRLANAARGLVLIRTRPWARYVRLLCLGAWLTWMCFTTKLLVSRPLVSALASAFLRRPRRNSADLTGQRALETPKALPVLLSAKFHIHARVQYFQFSGTARSIPFPRKTHLDRWRPLTLRSAASAAGVPPHGNGLLLLQDIAEEGEGALKLPSVNGLSRLAGVLERGAEVAAASPGGLCVVDGDCCVADLRAISRSLFLIERIPGDCIVEPGGSACDVPSCVRWMDPVLLVEVGRSCTWREFDGRCGLGKNASLECAR